MNPLQSRPAPGVLVETRGEVTPAAPDHARTSCSPCWSGST
ncbi:hypothetical protein [Streptomyces sp. NRRL B-24484]|nr:hypothetical protein [Streptomyces sp. NRRL B-24484]